MKNQTRLTEHLFTRSSSSSPHLQLPAFSRAAASVPSVESSRVPLIAPSLEPSSNPPSSWGSSHAPSVSLLSAIEEIHISPRQVESPVETDEDDDATRSEGEEDEDATHSEGEEEDMDHMLDATGSEPKAKQDIHGWKELHEQIRDDQRSRHKQGKSPAQMNQLTILQNFATLHIKGLQHIAVSEEITWQWHDGAGIYFTHRIRFLARHYQLFKQLPPENRGGCRGHSLLNDEQIQAAARAHLSTLPKGEVTPKRFYHALHERILPNLGWMLRKPLSERTARRWLIKLGWRRTMLKKGVYIDGHESPDIAEYQKNTFLPLMALHEKKMVQWVVNESRLVRIEPDLGPDEKRVIAIFQDESSFHANEYKQTVWCTPCFLFPGRLV
jgi:hypothetical protein